VPAGDANTDTLLVAFGNGEGSPEGDVITAINGSQLALRTTANFRGPPPRSGLQWAPRRQPPQRWAVPHSGAGNSRRGARISPSRELAPSMAATLFNFGSNPRILAYAVRAGNLTFCDYLTANCGAACTAADGSCSANWIPIANNIVSLRAQYGRDTSTHGRHYRHLGSNDTSATFACQPGGFCLSVGKSLLHCALHSSLATARSNVTQSPRRRHSGPAAPMIRVDLSARNNWQNYRYKVFETVIPLRNLPWMVNMYLRRNLVPAPPSPVTQAAASAASSCWSR
jgi:type IV pilus assembly protein PilW